MMYTSCTCGNTAQLQLQYSQEEASDIIHRLRRKNCGLVQDNEQLMVEVSDVNIKYDNLDSE